MEEYKPASHKYKAEQKEKEQSRSEKKVEKVVKGTVKTRKKNKLTGVFISEDASNVKSYILMDVLVPAIKKAVSDIVRDGIDMILYGESGRSRKSDGGRSTNYVSYRSYSDRDRRDERRYESRRAYDYNDIILESKREAEEVLQQMEEMLDRYEVVSVADLYDLVGITGSYTDNKYGWTSLRSADSVRVRDGYLLKLPRPTPI